MLLVIFTLMTAWFDLCISQRISADLSSSGKWKCDSQSKKEVDETVARIMTYGRIDRAFPTDKNELRPYCKYAIVVVILLYEFSYIFMNFSENNLKWSAG